MLKPKLSSWGPKLLKTKNKKNRFGIQMYNVEAKGDTFKAKVITVEAAVSILKHWYQF